MNDNTLYSLQVEAVSNRRLLLNITGKRDTIIEAALRVMLDSAVSWRETMRPTFNVTVQKIT